MDKVEKFKELFFQITEICFNLGWVKDEEKNKKLNEKYVEKSNELIKMYEEKQEKPVIRCKELYVNINHSCGYEIQFINLKNYEVKTYKGTLSCKEKDGMLITDDFIFIKE